MSSSSIAAAVVAWFRANARPLPWRATREPYAIWISEIMCQQTRVDTAAPYWERWMARFPTVGALAEAPLDEVLGLWAGLGYYGRARNLHRAARVVAAEHGGRLPGTADGLRALPGIGRYTAGAIASIAYDEATPVVDGNVARVLARLGALDDDVSSTAGQHVLWQRAAALVPADAPGDFNQGLMELGATTCTPAKPRCTACPLAGGCAARAAGRQDELPIVPRRKRADELPRLRQVAAWIERDGRVLLGQRPAGGLYGGLWELPQAADRPALEAAFAGRLALAPRAAVRHRQLLSHRRLEIELRAATLTGRVPRLAGYPRTTWCAPARLATLGVSTATRTIARRYLEER